MVVDDADFTLTALPDGTFQLACAKPFVQERAETIHDLLLVMRRRVFNLDSRLGLALSSGRSQALLRDTIKGAAVGARLERDLSQAMFGTRRAPTRSCRR